MSHVPAFRLTRVHRYPFAATSIPAELQRPVQDREPEIVVTASTTMSRLAALNDAFDALQAEQAERRHLFRLRRGRDPIQPAQPRGQPREVKTLTTDRPTLRTIAIGRIYPGAELRRNFPDAELDELTESIRQQGVLQPLLVRLMAMTSRL
jgi:hypothetical protein